MKKLIYILSVIHLGVYGLLYAQGNCPTGTTAEGNICSLSNKNTQLSCENAGGTWLDICVPDAFLGLTQSYGNQI